jgi:hypothetical protein
MFGKKPRELHQRYLAEISAAIELLSTRLIAGHQVALTVIHVAAQAVRDRPKRSGIERV